MSVSSPNITVCIPCHNHNEFVEEAVESAVMQDVDSLTIILSDDGSTDGAAEKCLALKKKYPSIIDLILHKENIGLHANLKFIEERINPQTKYVNWFSADDIFLPEKLKKQLDFLENNHDYIACYHNVSVFQNGLRTYDYNHFIYGQKAYAGEITDKLIENGCFVSGLSLLIRWPPSLHLTQSSGVGEAADWMYYIQISMLGKVGYINEILGVYRRHAGNISKKSLLKDHHDPVYTYLLQEYPAFKNSIEKGRTRSCVALMGKALLRRDISVFSACFKNILKDIARNPMLLLYCVKILTIMGAQRLSLYFKTGDMFR